MCNIIYHHFDKPKVVGFNLVLGQAFIDGQLIAELWQTGGAIVSRRRKCEMRVVPYWYTTRISDMSTFSCSSIDDMKCELYKRLR